MEHLRETWRDLSKTASGRRTLGKYTRVRGVTPHQSSVTTWRERVDALPESYTPAIMSAVENVYDQGYNEDDDEFWERVYGEVMA